MSFARLTQRILPKCVLHVQHDSLILLRSANHIRELQHQRGQRQCHNFIGRMRKSHSAARTARTSEQFCAVIRQTNNVKLWFWRQREHTTFNLKFPILISTVLPAVHFYTSVLCKNCIMRTRCDNHKSLGIQMRKSLFWSDVFLAVVFDNTKATYCYSFEALSL